MPYTSFQKYAAFLISIALVLLIVFSVLPVRVLANGPQQQDPTKPPTSNKIENPLAGGTGINSIDDFVQAVLNIMLKIGIPIVAFFIIYAGFQFVIAQGNAEKLEKAKRTLLYTLIGGALLLGAWVIAMVVKATILAIIA